MDRKNQIKFAAYNQYREEMRDGDILLFKGSSFLSRVIQWKTKSAYSHAGLVIWWNGRLMVLEAVGKGVRATPISYNLKKYAGGIDYYRSVDYIPTDNRKQMVDFAQLQLGKEYDLKRQLEFFFKLLRGERLKVKESDKEQSTYFCSEYVSEVYEVADIDLVEERSSQFTSPDKLADSDKLEFVGTLTP